MNQLVVILSLIMFGFSCAYLFVQDQVLQVSEHVISDSKISADFNNYKIAHISDFHSTSSIVLKHMLLKQLTSSNIDLIVITGDLIDERHIGWNSSLSFISKIIKIAPVCFVSGNHEVTNHKYEEFLQKLTNLGVIVLRNDKHEIKKQNSTIMIYGMEDPAIMHNHQIAITAKSFLQSFETKSTEYNILLAHRPELFRIYSHKDFDLIFTGHAHGGQFRIPGIGGVFSPGEGLWPKYTEGSHDYRGSKMIVSRGLGRSSFPFRINNRPELVLVTLQQAIRPLN